MKATFGVGMMGLVAALLAAFGSASYGQWSGSQLLNQPSDAGSDVKTARIVASKNGGFHSIYHVNNQIRYRRYNGTLQAPVVVFPGTNFMANGRIAEALNGDIHVIFEDWAGGGPEARWYKSSDGGASFPFTQVLTNSGGTAKHPYVVPFGTGTSAEMVMSYYRAGSKQLYYARYNGSSWTAESYIGSNSNSGYDCFGMERSPLNGSIYRSFDPNGSTMRMRQFTGSWQPEIPLLSGVWAVRQHIAINKSGQVMLMWDMNEQIYTMLYTPGVGAAPATLFDSGGYAGSCGICAIPGSDHFYGVVGREQKYVVGRHWAGGRWQPGEQLISNGLPQEFTVSPSVTADSTGTIYCAWEYWGSGKPQQYYSIMANPVLLATPTSFSRNVPPGVNPSDDSFIVTNGGPGTISYTITSSATWVTPIPATGTATCTQDNPVVLRYNLAGLMPGSYGAVITVAGSGAYNSPRTIYVNVNIAPIAQDFDQDGDVDLADYALFQMCFNGPNEPPAAGGCTRPDLDGDGDVDLGDFALFQSCFNGANRLPACI